MKTTTGKEYELRDMTLKEREHCNNKKSTIKNVGYDMSDGKVIMTGDVIVDIPATVRYDWVRAGLKSLEGIEIITENRENTINTLSEAEITEISGEISERTNGGIKKKF